MVIFLKKIKKIPLEPLQNPNGNILSCHEYLGNHASLPFRSSSLEQRQECQFHRIERTPSVGKQSCDCNRQENPPEYYHSVRGDSDGLAKCGSWMCPEEESTFADTNE